MKHLITMLFALVLIGLTGCGSSGNGGSSVVTQVTDVGGNERNGNGGGDQPQIPNPDNNGANVQSPEPGTDGTPAPATRSIPLPTIVPNYLEFIRDEFYGAHYRADYLDEDGNYNTLHFSNKFGSVGVQKSFVRRDVRKLSADYLNQVWIKPYEDWPGWVVRKYDETDQSLGLDSSLTSNPTNLKIIIGGWGSNSSDDLVGKTEIDIIRSISHHSSFFATGGNTIRNLPIGTHNYGGIGNSINLVKVGSFKYPASDGIMESGAVDIEANFDHLLISINGATQRTKITSDMNINPSNGSFIGKGRINLVGLSNSTDNYSETILITGTFHGNMAEGVSGVYHGLDDLNGAFIANKR